MDEHSPLWTDWLREHGPALLLYARQWAAQQADAEDIFQEAFVRFWPHRAAVGDPLAYLYSCVRHTAQDWQRRRRNRSAQQLGPPERHPAVARPEVARSGPSFLRPMVEAEPPWFEPVDAPLIQEEMARQVQEAISALPEEQREVVVLKIWGGLSFSAIGQVMGTSPHTAASRYRYALKTLQAQLRKALHQ